MVWCLCLNPLLQMGVFFKQNLKEKIKKKKKLAIIIYLSLYRALSSLDYLQVDHYYAACSTDNR